MLKSSAGFQPELWKIALGRSGCQGLGHKISDFVILQPSDAESVLGGTPWAGTGGDGKTRIRIIHPFASNSGFWLPVLFSERACPMQTGFQIDFARSIPASVRAAVDEPRSR